ncbi:MAG TPA: response regulator [Acidimicrobiales bacterium]|nr:response regulator [Acidimicrobiales bacterium]
MTATIRRPVVHGTDTRLPSLVDPFLVPVLVVDDNAGKRLALTSALAPLGYHIIEADSGVTALRCVTAHDFAVILLDVRMPIMDGIETAALIRQRRQSEMTPIIFLTADENNESLNSEGYAEGAVDFIVAPVSPDELRAKVSVFANLFSRARDLAAQAMDVQISADQLRILTDSAPIGIFRTDPDNRYVYTNRRWSEITGLPAEDAAGRDWDTIVSADQRSGVTGLPGVTSDGSENPRRFEIRLPDSTTRVVIVTSKSIPDTDGGTAGWVGTLADITAEAGAEAAMSVARDEATEASRLKSDFLANMSHEIRTPMNGVIGMTDLLLETDLDARQRDYAQTVRNSGEALLSIINDILDFSKVEAGKLEIENVDFNLQSIVEDVVDLLAGPAYAKGLDLIAAVDKGVPDIVTGDPGRVRQVLTNLVGNALKFTQTGEIVVRAAQTDVDRRDAQETDVVIRFEVSDTGDGITADKLDLIFAPFVQADTSTSRRYGGTGLGLAISSQLVALMGGTCGVSSEPGVGSTFWFSVRLRAPSRHPMPDPSPGAGLAGVRALIVSDRATQRHVLSDYLEDWGMSVRTAESGPSALLALRTEAAEGRPFAVTIVDWSLAGTEGPELKNAITVDPALNVFLVLLTDVGQELDFTNAVQSAACVSLSRPVHKDQLGVCLRVVLGLQHAEVTPAHHVTSSPSASGTFSGHRLLLAEDNLINQKVAVAMLSSAGYTVDTVLNGADAVKAVAARSYDAVLMDCQMPELNGYEATAAIRALKSSGRLTPVIAMTAGARPEDRDRCMAEGMDAYVSKPVSKDALLALVASSVTSGRAASGTLAPSAPKAVKGPVHQVTIDRTAFDDLRLLGEQAGEGFLADLVGQFVTDTELLLADLRLAMKIDDAPAVARMAHSIKGASDQLGGRRFALSCSRLERMATADSLVDCQDLLQELEHDYRDLRQALAREVATPARHEAQSRRG